MGTVKPCPSFYPYTERVLCLLFSSIPFLFYFLPIVLILYFAVPKVFKNSVLLLSSLFFYAWGEPKYVVLMVLSILMGYAFGLLIERFRGKALSKVFVTLSVVFSLAILGYFKYADFFIDNFASLTGLSIPLLNIALPIGISFYTFQILSYTVDVYRGDAAAQKNPITLGAYIAMFPQLIAGPIVRYRDVEIQLNTRTHSIQKAAGGIKRFMIGLCKKILIANLLGEITAVFLASTDLSVLFYWLNAVAFSLQIYFDFSGYSDMAIGLGRIFGFEFLENFNYPYISKSITEFWRRWHMSLGQWFRDYVYIPMGGNRVSKARHFINILVVWMLTGFWHGASWNFVLWGLYFALLLMLEKYLLLDKLKKSKVLSRIFVLLFVLISFVIFDSPTLPDIVKRLLAMFGFSSIPLVSKEALYYLGSYAFVLILAVIGATPLPKMLYAKLSKNKAFAKITVIMEPVLLAVMLIVVTAFLVDGSFNPFLYFRF